MIEKQTKIGFVSLFPRHIYVTLGVKGLIWNFVKDVKALV
jgi:hypothetical protein